ncbi:sugar ABC transporter permease (plasmid) [Deinococcus aetherius]|uniref:Sugar ABC transporter permease n=1 Tax=Deinococcus aetherius TaxID=200252 RepID=A0ABN6RJX1_9DEIO|nr:carbohydrate ABC transporter permease [Deinococcus aetherius]BDP43637.1 sugar ABC transporter permease [Deinococcus aetherius]
MAAPWVSAAPRTRAATRTRRRAHLTSSTLRFVLLLLQAIIFLAPVYWMIATSLKPEGDTVAQPIQWYPHSPTLENYARVLTSPDSPVVRWTLNSAFTSLAFTFGTVLTCSLAAYAIARLKFRGREAWFWFILSSMMVPGLTTLIPSFIMMLKLGWIDTYHALIWPSMGGAFGVFMLRQFFTGIPFELEEAARLDGANSLQVFRHVIVPLSKPALATLTVFTFLGAWNSVIWPLYVVHGDMATLPAGLASFQGIYATTYGTLMAGTTLTALPALVAYLFAQRYLEEGLTLTGLKE